MRGRQHELDPARSEVTNRAAQRSPRRRKTVHAGTTDGREIFSACFEHAAIGLSITDLDGRVLAANSAYCSITGYDEAELINIDSQLLIHPSDRPLALDKMRALIAGDIPTFAIEQRCFKNDGSTAWVHNSVSLVHDKAGRPSRIAWLTQEITERKKSQEAAHNYSRRLIEAHEAERRRIARALHDQVGQILTAVKMNLHALHHECADPRTLSSIDNNLKVIDEAVDQVRGLSVDLRPLLLDDFGLVVALRWYLERQTRNVGIPAKFVSGSLDEDDRFSSELETACFRIVQEGVTNIVRHARASRISVRLERVFSHLVLSISDDGAGFDVRILRSGNGTATLGLRGMEERAHAVGGTITIESAPARGTEICARFPIKDGKYGEAESSMAVEFVKA